MVTSVFHCWFFRIRTETWRQLTLSAEKRQLVKTLNGVGEYKRVGTEFILKVSARVRRHDVGYIKASTGHDYYKFEYLTPILYIFNYNSTFYSRKCRHIAIRTQTECLLSSYSYAERSRQILSSCGVYILVLYIKLSSSLSVFYLQFRLWHRTFVHSTSSSLQEPSLLFCSRAYIFKKHPSTQTTPVSHTSTI